jgi:glutaredoxin
MASWCGACKAAAKYLRSRDVPFVEKDIEKDRAAASEMQAKAQAAGKTPRGVPVIDFRGTILLGFDQQALSTLIDQGAAAKPNPI